MLARYSFLYSCGIFFSKFIQILCFPSCERFQMLYICSFHHSTVMIIRVLLMLRSRSSSIAEGPRDALAS